MSKTYRDWTPDQIFLLPPSPRDWLPEGDLVYFLLDTVAILDLTPLFAHYGRELRGQPPFHPRMSERVSGQGLHDAMLSCFDAAKVASLPTGSASIRLFMSPVWSE